MNINCCCLFSEIEHSVMQGDGAAKAGAQPVKKRLIFPTWACTGVSSSDSLVLCFKNSAHLSMRSLVCGDDVTFLF